MCRDRRLRQRLHPYRVPEPPKILEITLNNGVDPRTGKDIGKRTGSPSSWVSFEDLLRAYEEQLRHFIDVKIKGNNIIENLYAGNMPCPFLSTIISDCIENGTDYNAGGDRYHTRYIQGVGIASITDSLAAMKELVFERRLLTADELVAVLSKNFEDAPSLREIAVSQCPKYGNDDDRADGIMKRVFDMFYGLVDGRRSPTGGTYHIDML